MNDIHVKLDLCECSANLKGGNLLILIMTSGHQLMKILPTDFSLNVFSMKV